MSTFTEGLSDIKDAVSQASSQWIAQADAAPEQAPAIATEHVLAALKQLDTFNNNLASIRKSIAEGVTTKQLAAPPAPAAAQQSTAELLDPEKHKVVVVHKVPRAFLDLVKAQFSIIESWMAPFLKLSQESAVDLKDLNSRVNEAFGRYHDLIERLEDASEKSESEH